MNFKAISIDDEITNLKLIEALGAEIGLEIESHVNPYEALDQVNTRVYDLIFIDYMMPELDGITLIQEIRKKHKHIPIIMITAVHGDTELKLHAIESGANEFLNKPINVAEFKARVQNLLELRRAHNLLHDKAKLLESEVMKATETILERENETLDIVGRMSEYKDTETGVHIARVAYYSKLLAKSIKLNDKQQDLIFKASPLHDIGKVGIPDTILTSKNKLSKHEEQIIKTHPYIGYNILKETKSQYLRVGSIISLSHHEKYNGTGYPRKLKKNSIPIFGRIVAISDVFDALSSERPYKDAWPLHDVFQYIKDERENHFDPELVDHFFSNMDEIRYIFETLRSDDD